MMSISDQIAKARQECLEEIEAFLVKHDVAVSRFGRSTMGDPRFVYELRAGRKIGPEVIDGLRAYMRAYRPPKRIAGNAPAVAA
jgi:hypothetical protein